MSIKGGAGGAGGGDSISTSGEAGGSTAAGCDSAGAGSVLVCIGEPCCAKCVHPC